MTVTVDVSIVNMADVTDVTLVVYLSQDDIAGILGVPRNYPNVWRRRYRNTPRPFPKENSLTGIGKRGIPGWLPERIDEIKTWVVDRGLEAPGIPDSERQRILREIEAAARAARAAETA